MHYLLSEINKTKKQKIIIITAYHHNLYGKMRNNSSFKKYVSTSNEKSKTFLKEFMDKIPKHFQISLRSSNNPDDDFLFLCSANELLLSSQSQFAVTAQKIQHIFRAKQYYPVPKSKHNMKMILNLK